MPRYANPKSALRSPLDYVLGTRSSVSVLRTLSRSGAPLSQAELARRAGLNLRGLPETLATLETAGIVSYAGRGRSRQIHLYDRHPLVHLLRQLFQAETNRWNEVVQQLKSLASTLGTELIAAWIEGPVATEEDGFTDPVNATLLFDKQPDSATQEAARQRANGLQAAQHVVIALRFHQRADLLRFTAERRVQLERAILLYGPAPIDLLAAKADPATHEHKRVRSDAGGDATVPIAQTVAARLTHDPEVATRAREFVERRLAVAGATERLTLLEWKGLLDSLTPGQLAALLREDSDRADRLRKSLPFLSVLAGPDSRNQQ